MKDKTVAILLAISIFIAGVAVGRMINYIVANKTDVVNVDPVVSPSEPAVSPSEPIITPTMPTGVGDEDEEDEDEEDEDEEDEDEGDEDEEDEDDSD